MRRAAILTLLAITAATAAAEEGPQIRSVVPSFADSLLVCRVLTSGIPDAPSAESIESGAPAAVLLTLRLMDGEERVVSERHVECRIVLDLWEGAVRVRTGGEESRLADMDAVRGHFADLAGLPVALRRTLVDGRRYRVHVRADSRPVAPQEEARIREWVAGGGPGDAEGREVFIGLGSLIRFFFGSARRGEAEGVSPWFVSRESGLETH